MRFIIIMILTYHVCYMYVFHQVLPVLSYVSQRPDAQCVSISVFLELCDRHSRAESGDLDWLILHVASHTVTSYAGSNWDLLPWAAFECAANHFSSLVWRSWWETSRLLDVEKGDGFLCFLLSWADRRPQISGINIEERYISVLFLSLRNLLTFFYCMCVVILHLA